MKRLAIFFPFAAALVFAAACSSDPDPVTTADAATATDAATTSDGSTPTDSSVPATDSATTDAGDGATACSAFANTAPVVTDTVMGTAVPVGTGTAIADGTYFMTANTHYQGGSTTIKTHTFTVKIAGTVWGMVGHDNSDPEVNGSFTITSALSGTFSLTGTCPAALVGKVLGAFDSYTATPTTITLYSSSKKNSTVFTKQ